MSYQPSTLGRNGHKLDLPMGNRLEDRSSAVGAALPQHRLALDWPSTPAPTHASGAGSFPALHSRHRARAVRPSVFFWEKEGKNAAREDGYIDKDRGCTGNPQEFTANPPRFAETEHGFASKERGLPSRELEFQLETLPCFLLSQPAV